MSLRYYFAYGSNMDKKQMERRCPHASFFAIGELDGYRFIINERGVATITEKKSSIVWGVVWKISRSDEESLDGFEGVMKKGFYVKRTVQVKTTQETLSPVLVYVDEDTIEGSARAGYTETLLAAAKVARLPKDYINEQLTPWLNKNSETIS